MLINTKLQVPSGETDVFVPTGCPAEGGGGGGGGSRSTEILRSALLTDDVVYSL